MRYKQDLPPPGGYGRIPFLRNLPIRGPSGVAILGAFGAFFYSGVRFKRSQRELLAFVGREEREVEMCLFPLLEAEKDRYMLRQVKEKIETEALNIVGTGYDPSHDPGAEMSFYNAKRWRKPYQSEEHDYSLPAGIKSWYYFFFRTDKLGP